MPEIPPYIYLIGALMASIGLMISWSRHIYALAETRRIQAIAQGETAPDIKGVSNYERAELMESAHRASKVTSKERWIGRAIYFGVPAVIISVYLSKHPL